MKNKLLLLISLLSISVMTAQTITPKNWVTDLGDLYTPEQEANLNSIISAYEKKTSDLDTHEALQEKEAKEAKERAAAWESFKSGLIKFVLVACFIGLLVFIYVCWILILFATNIL